MLLSQIFATKRGTDLGEVESQNRLCRKIAIFQRFHKKQPYANATPKI